MDKISVIIPTYKNRGGLKQSIQSVVDQKYDNIEIIVVDDNGLGTSYQVKTQEIISAFPSVIYIPHEKNRNGAAARNTGIKAATGDYIAFLDDDDLFLPDKLLKQQNYLKANPQFNACYCFTNNPDGSHRKTVPFKGDVSEQLLLLSAAMPTSTLMFKKQAILDINGFDESYRRHQDYEILLRFFMQGLKIGCVEEYLMQWGKNNGENNLHGCALEEMKSNFLKQFDNVITRIDKSKHGIKNRIYAIHYSNVFIDHIKMHHWRMALNILFKYFPKGPEIFIKQVYFTSKHQLLKL